MCIYITSGIHPTRVELAPLPGMASRQPHHVHLWVFWFAYDAWEKLAMVTAGHISFYVFVSNEFKTGQSPLVTVLVTQTKQDYSHKLVLRKLDHISQNYPCSLLPVLSVLKFSLNVDIWL